MGRCVVLIIRNGKVWGQRHYHDNRRLMATLTRLARLTRPREDKAPHAKFQSRTGSARTR